ncbi:hypothetical protein [Helicobacter cinaedi]|uniref:hypothetical protein n=1 Tax=Helicobacter cinaedi TaxID=213 RepID=UPI001E58020A|nr:hypothetical protein [Helicobacter cinaedi]
MSYSPIHQTTTTNPNFQINRQAKLSQRYIITDAKLSTKKPPLQNKSKVLVQSVSFKDKKYIHYKANDTLTFQAHYNNTKLSQEELKEAKANTKWAYILSTDETLPQKLDYRKITQEGSDSPYIGEDYTLTLKKEYFDINKATYLHIFAYINVPSSKVKQVLKLEYPLSLRFNGKELHIVEWGKPTHSFVAQSGISHHTNTAHTQQANKNQIEEKTCYINVNDKEESNLAEQFLVFIKNTIQKNTQQEDKGTQFFRLYESKDALYPLNQSNTTAYTLHTGNEYGDYKGIDLAKDNELTQNRKDSTNQSHTQTSLGLKI